MKFFKKLKDTLRGRKGYAVSFLTLTLLGSFMLKPEKKADEVFTVKFVEKVEKICFGGDAGLNNEYQEKTAKLMYDRGCKFIVHLGDNNYRHVKNIEDMHDFRVHGELIPFESLMLGGEEDPDKGVVVYNDAVQSLNELITRWYVYYNFLGVKNIVVPGNHDYAWMGKLDPWFELSKLKANVFHPNNFQDYYFSNSGVCIIALDSTPYHLSRVGKSELVKEQNKWMKKALKYKHCEYKILIAHHPLWSNEDNHGDATGDYKEKMEKWKKHVDAMVFGHSHILSIIKNQIISGALAKLRKCVEREPGDFCLADYGFFEFYPLTKEWRMVTLSGRDEPVKLHK